MRFAGFIGPSYTLKSVNVDCQRCVNLYPEMNELGTGKEREVAYLIGTPGLSTLATMAASVCRGMWTATNGILYAVYGAKCYKVSSAWSATELGTLNSSTGPVSMADNGTHLCMVDGTDGYVVTLATDAFAEITDVDFPGADQVTFQDGYFIFNEPDTGRFFISGLNSTAFDALDIATSEGNPDNVVAVMSDHRDLWVFNAKTTEVFFNSGNADFPFERVQGAFIEHGCAAAFSVAKMNNTVFWLGQDERGAGIVYMATGYQPQRISTHAVENAIRSYGDISTAVAYTYQEDGHFFYVLNCPNASTTWVFDSSTGMWHERVYTNAGVFERHRAQCHAYAYSTHIVGDYANGKLYSMSSSVYSDAGDEISRTRIAPHATSGLKLVRHNSFQLDMEVGVGIDGSGQGVDPQVMMKFSDDGGHVWSNEKWVACGRIGQRKQRALWRRLGMSRDRVYSVTITDPVKVILIGAEINAVPGGA